MEKILIVDDKEAYASMLAEALQLKGYEAFLETDSSKAFQTAQEKQVDLVISDFAMAPLNGLDVLRAIKKWDPTVPVILVTDKQHHPEVVREAEKEGCLDFLSKGSPQGQKLMDFDDLYSKVSRALKFRALMRENQRLRTKFHLENVIGCSRQMEEVYAIVQKVAPTDCTVLIQGESGTGKELVAQALHQLSPRKDHPLVPINCGGMPEHLLESELFGHKRGAFTNAFSDKRGLFEEAEGGTLFLDEIGTLPLSLQAKLLRVLQEREIRRVGDNVTIKVNVRIVAATNVPLSEMITKSLFREDLYYRLSVIPIEVPPLRNRIEDIPLLAGHFLKHSQVRQLDQEIRISQEAMDVLCGYHWPGNVRELQNVIERTIVLCNGSVIQPSDLPPKLREGPALAAPVPVVKSGDTIASLDEVVTQVEFDYCTRVVQRFQGNKRKAAEALQISVPAIYRKLKPATFPKSKPVPPPEAPVPPLS